MKKFLIAVVISILLVGCIEYKEPEKVIIDGIESKNGVPDRAYKFTYQGHNYIFFTSGNSNCSVGGVVHDPDCPCHKKQK